jgi:proteic killer suppression protein
LYDFFFKRLSLPKIKPIAKRLLSKLKVLHRERSWKGLKNFFRNDLEEMKGEWKEWGSIRINNQYRIIFKWGKDNNAYKVDLTKHYQKANL